MVAGRLGRASLICVKSATHRKIRLGSIDAIDDELSNNQTADRGVMRQSNALNRHSLSLNSLKVAEA
jgi:hypothetical protein